MSLLRSFCSACLFAFACLSQAQTSAVILQYHFVGDDTPAITSVSSSEFVAHLDWLSDNGFLVLPLEQIVDTLKRGEHFGSDKVAGISFDDAGLSVCTTAWPILKRRQLPFTVFINTDPIERGFVSQCSWQMLKTMADSGLMTPANHSHTHAHMASFDTRNQREWRNTVRYEIDTAQNLIAQRLGRSSQLFAYPYGEYSDALAALVLRLGYTGFGQHSGAIGAESNFAELPRFPASGQYAALDTLSVKLMSLALPSKVEASVDSPVAINSPDNPPRLRIAPLQKLSNPMQCFYQNRPIVVSEHAEIIDVYSEKPLPEGRNRYNCTSESATPGRFYWLSHQWLME